jgi:hypothetical protein
MLDGNTTVNLLAFSIFVLDLHAWFGGSTSPEGKENINPLGGLRFTFAAAGVTGVFIIIKAYFTEARAREYWLQSKLDVSMVFFVGYMGATLVQTWLLFTFIDDMYKIDAEIPKLYIAPSNTTLLNDVNPRVYAEGIEQINDVKFPLFFQDFHYYIKNMLERYENTTGEYEDSKWLMFDYQRPTGE